MVDNMRKFVFVVTLALSLVNSPVCSADQSIMKPGDVFLKDWKSVEEPVRKTAFRQEWGGDGKGLEHCNHAIETLLEQEQLTSKAQMTIKVSPTEVPSYQILKMEGTPADRFKFEQAIWETAPFIGMLSRPSGVTTLKQMQPSHVPKSEIQFFDEHPEKRGKAVVIHVIPRTINDYERCFNALTSENLDQQQNLRAISMQKLQSPELKKFRNEWVLFVLKSPRSTNRQQILDFAAHLLNKYQSLFEVSREWQSHPLDTSLWVGLHENGRKPSRNRRCTARWQYSHSLSTHVDLL